MKLTAPAFLCALAAFGSGANAAAWSMTSYQGMSCSTSAPFGKWAVGPQANTCIKFTKTKSLKVTAAGPCKTTYYRSADCSGPSFLANKGVCTGFDGQIVGSFKVVCTA